MKTTSIHPKEMPVGKLFGLLTGAVSPRPIAFASTIDKKGNVNLSPFSFFNVFGANPPIFVFSPSRKVRDNTTKDTLENLHEVPEVVINMVNYAMVEQMSLASTAYEKGINEFIKAGFTQVASDIIQPPRVQESPVAFECKVLDIISTGDGGGAGNLVICEGLKIHIADAILDEDGDIDPIKMDAVARLGKNWYSRVNEQSLFEVEKPLAKTGIGVDQIPNIIRHSDVLTGNDLGKLGNVEVLPTKSEVQEFSIEAIDANAKTEKEYHQLAQNLLKFNKVKEAWLVLLKSS